MIRLNRFWPRLTKHITDKITTRDMNVCWDDIGWITINDDASWTIFCIFS